MLIKLVMLGVFIAVTVAIGLVCRRHAADVNAFVLGGRSVGPWLSAFAYGTSYFSAVIFIGYAGQFGWKYGIASTWIGLGNALLGSLLAWLVLGRRTRRMTQYLASATMPDFFGKRYQSPALKIGASILVFVFLIPYTASLYNGLSRLFGMAFDIDYTLCIVIMALLTGIYVIAGGYMATAVNDFFQGVIMLAGIVAIILAVLRSNGGFTEALIRLSQVEDVGVSAQQGAFASFFGPDPLNLLGVIVLTSMGTWGLPQMVQKFYAIKGESAIQKGAVISTLFAAVVAGGCYFLGGFGRLYPIDVAALGYDAVVPAMLSTLSPFFIGLAVTLVLSASMSTLSSLVMASSSTLTLDFLMGNIVKDTSEKKKVLLIRVLIAFFIIISAVIAIIQYKSKVTFIAQLMGISWGALAGSFLAPFLYGLYWKSTSKAAVWASFVTSTGLMLVNLLLPSALPALLRSPINCGAASMLLNLVLVPLVSLVTPKPDRAFVEDTFSCFQLQNQPLSGEEPARPVSIRQRVSPSAPGV